MGTITTEGFTRDTLDTILQGIQNDELRPAEEGGVSPSLDLSTSEPIGQINGIVAEALADNEELLEICYHGFDDGAAEGDQLEIIAAFSGTLRRGKVKCTDVAEFNLDSGTVLPANFGVRPPGDSTRIFETISSFTAPSTGWHEVPIRAATAGPVFVASGQLTQIISPLAGVNAVENYADIDGGLAVESDDELRLRRRAELQRAGQTTLGAMRSELSGLAGVISCRIFENNENTQNADGMPAHSIEVLVHDGFSPTVANADIAAVILANLAPGAKTHGNTEIDVLDEEGNTKRIRFSRPTQKNVYSDIFATRVSGSTPPVDATTLLRNHLTEEANKLVSPGADVVALALRAIVYNSIATKSYAWLYDVQNLELGFSASPSGTANLEISDREIARFQLANVTATLL